MSLILNPRFIAVVLLVFLIGFVIVLFITREAPIWQKIPGLDRVTQTLSSFGTESSAQVRILGWKLAVNAFLEKPIFGWGPEHYLVAFERRYDPEFDAYGEVWLDRSHNGILDVAATQGTVGLVGYVGFLISIFYFFFQKGNNFNLRFFAGVIFLGFTIQNLFFLEEFHVYAPFFVLVSAIVVGMFIETNDLRSMTNDPLRPRSETSKQQTTNNLALVIVGSVVVFGLLSFVLYKAVIIPLVQAYYTYKTETSQSKEEFLGFFNRAIEPYNFAQYSIRGHIFDLLYTNQSAVFTDPKLADVGGGLIRSVREYLEREGPYDTRSHIRLSQGYYEMAKQSSPTKDFIESEALGAEWPMSYYRAGEEVLREALEANPQRQILAYEMGIFLAASGRYEEAVEFMRKSVELSMEPARVARYSYYYGLVLSAAGRDGDALQAFENMMRADPQLNFFSVEEIVKVLGVYESLGEYERIIDVIVGSARGQIPARLDLRYYETALSYYLLKENSEEAITVAGFIAEEFTERQQDMETIIELIRSDEWEILRNL